MRDLLGNKVIEGNLVLWHISEEMSRGGLIFRVIEVREPTIETPGATQRQPILSLRIDIPIGVEKGREAVLAGLMRVVDPASEVLIEQATAGDGTLRMKAKPQ